MTRARLPALLITLNSCFYAIMAKGGGSPSGKGGGSDDPSPVTTATPGGATGSPVAGGVSTTSPPTTNAPNAPNTSPGSSTAITNAHGGSTAPLPQPTLGSDSSVNTPHASTGLSPALVGGIVAIAVTVTAIALAFGFFLYRRRSKKRHHKMIASRRDQARSPASWSTRRPVLPPPPPASLHLSSPASSPSPPSPGLSSASVSATSEISAAYYNQLKRQPMPTVGETSQRETGMREVDSGVSLMGSVRSMALSVPPAYAEDHSSGRRDAPSSPLSSWSSGLE